MIATLKTAYTKVKGHLIKILGGLGATLLTIDPQSVENAASTYLGAGVQRKVGVALFLLVTARAWYAGNKAAALQAQVDALQAASAGKTLP